jgi:hypothetical protein
MSQHASTDYDNHPDEVRTTLRHSLGDTATLASFALAAATAAAAATEHTLFQLSLPYAAVTQVDPFHPRAHPRGRSPWGPTLQAMSDLLQTNVGRPIFVPSHRKRRLSTSFGELGAAPRGTKLVHHFLTFWPTRSCGLRDQFSTFSSDNRRHWLSPRTLVIVLSLGTTMGAT